MSVSLDLSIAPENLRQHPLVLYGAGRFAPLLLPELQAQGLTPVCFCDQDIEKQASGYLGLPVLSIQQLQVQYPGCYIYIALATPLRYQVQEELVSQGIIGQSKIANFTPVNWSKGCYRIEEWCTIGPAGLNCCCTFFPGVKQPRYVPVGTDLDAGIDAFLSEVDELRQLNQTDTCPCDGCPALVEQYWPDTPRISFLSISSFFLCQMHCIYCNQSEIANPQHLPVWEHYDGLAVAQRLQQRGLLSESLTSTTAGGELALNPKCNEIIDFLASISDTCTVYTNAAKYISHFATLSTADKQKFILQPSLDAGTRETFRQVKQVDLFEALVDTLNRYHADGLRLFLKYIILPENCSLADLSGFLNICKQLEVERIVLSCDMFTHNNQLQDFVVDAACYILSNAQKMGIPCHFSFECFGSENLKAIRAFQNSLADVLPVSP